MKVLVAWSGGLDSTALIDRLLKQGDQVRSIYVELPCNGVKVQREKMAIEGMLPHFKPYAFQHYGNAKFEFVGSSIFSLRQPTLWITGLLYALTSDIDAVNIAYVLNDDAVSYLPELRAIWDSYSGLTSLKLPPLSFPLIKVDKHTLWNDLPDDLKKHVTWCEHPTSITPCGDCHSCSRMKNVLKQLDNNISLS